jgi:hypothetical protein
MIDLASARAALGRTGIVLPDAVPAHPLLAGRREIGRGEYSIVLEKAEDPERVFKVLTSPADYFLYTADDRPRGPHFPVLFADHGTIGRASSGYPFRLVEMEHLYPLTPGSAAARLADDLLAAYWEGCQRWRELGNNMGRVALYHLGTATPGVEPGIAAALVALSDFTEAYQVLPDILNADNLMVRKDGTLVFSDPVFLG